MQVSRDKQIRILDMKYNHDTGNSPLIKAILTFL